MKPALQPSFRQFSQVTDKKIRKTLRKKIHTRQVLKMKRKFQKVVCKR